MGFRVVRRGFYWESVVPEPGQYDFSGYDTQMNRARELGLTVVGVLFGNNKRFENDGQGGIQTDAGRKGFAAFGAALARHYEDHDVIWEIWNEPNVRTFWRKNGKHNSDEFASEYTALVKAVVPAMLAADPDCFVVAGSVSNYWHASYYWTESCFERGVLQTGIRGWSVHPYGPRTPEEFAEGHGVMRKLLKKYGAPDLPLVNTERGFAVKKRGEGWSGGSLSRAREFQAWHFVRQYMADMLHGVAPTVWYEWDGDAFGIVDEGASRPIYTASRVMFERLDGCRFVRRLNSDSDLDYAMVFEDGQGRRTLVAWTAPPPGESPDETIDHYTAVRFTAPGAAPTALEAFDLMGEPASIEVRRGALRLAMRGAVQYVAIPRGLELGACERGAPLPGQESKLKTQRAPETSQGLELFDGASSWRVAAHHGKGAFTLGTTDRGKPMGILSYDFTAGTGRGTPYVFAVRGIDLPKDVVELWIHARTPLRQQLTLRVVDGTGQTHQFKHKTKGSNTWEAIGLNLTARHEKWGGANDGKIHFPTRELHISVPLPGLAHKTGTVEIADIRITTK